MHEITIIEELYLKAIQFPDPIERTAYLESACANEPDLRRKVEELLNAHAQVGKFLEPQLHSTQVYSPHGQAPTKEGVLIGSRYKLLEKIGEGGMGEVWMADQTEPVKRRVAVKLIKPGMDSRNVLARFAAERQALAVMDHPNIAKVLDGGLHEGRPFFVMELVRGTPITEFCDVRRLTPHQRLELMVPVCQAIQHAHQKGVIHRDIKPSNVLVELYDDVPVPKVIDFGVAKAVGQPLTEGTLFTGYGTLVGTPAYMAPEQATFNALDVDTRADVYALGTLLYELLAGSPPMEAERVKKAALEEVLRLVREEEPPRPSQRVSTSEARASIAAVRGSEPAKLTAQMRGELDWIVMKALEKDRTRRYESATALAKDLQRYLTGEAVEACPPTISYRLRKACFRNRSKLGIAAAIVGVLLSGLAVAGYAWKQRQDQRLATELAATKSIDEAMFLRGQAKAAPSGELWKWNEALVAAKQAEAVIQAGESGTILRERVAQLIASIENEEKKARQTATENQAKNQREQNLVASIEAIRIDFVEADEVHYYSADAKETIAKADEAYTRAFREFGIDVDTDVPSESAKKILDCSQSLEIVWAIDAWALNRKCLAMEEKNEEKGRMDSQWNPEKIAKAERLVQLAKLIDNDPWRCEFRVNACKPDYMMLLNKDQRNASAGQSHGFARMQELLNDEKILSSQPARALYVISLMIEHAWINEFGKDRRFQNLPVTKSLRKRAWQLKPNDFQIVWFISTECRSESERRAYALAAAAAAPKRKLTSDLELLPTDSTGGMQLLSKVEKVAKRAALPAWNFPYIAMESTTGDKVLVGPTRYELLSSEQREELGQLAAELPWLIRLEPENRNLREQLAKVLIRLNRVEESLKVCDEMAKRGETLHPAYVVGLDLYGMGELDRAKDLIEDMIKKNESVDFASYSNFYPALGAICYEMSLIDQASRAFESAHIQRLEANGVKVIRFVNNWGSAWHASGRPDAIVSTYQSLLDESVESKAGSKIDVDYAEAYIDGLQAGGGSIDWFKSRQNVVVAFSEYLQELGRIEDAIQLYKDWLDRDGGGRHRSKLCQLLIKSNRSDEAVQIYRDALAKSPNDGDLQESLVKLLVQLDKSVEAVQETKRLEKLYRMNVAEKPSRANKGELASVLWILDQRVEARQLYLDCIKDSTTASDLNFFAMEMAQMLSPEDRDPDLAIEAAIKLNEMTGYAHPMYLDTLATAYAAKGDFEKSINWQLKAIELNTNAGDGSLYEENLQIFRAGKALPPQDDYGRKPRSIP